MPTYRITIGGVTYEVEVGDLSRSPVSVEVNGQPLTVDWERVAQAPAAAAPSPAPPPVSAPAPAPARQPAAVAADANAVVAPMPGKVLAVRVKPGDSVAYGQELCLLEAMKMEQSIRSPRDGVIASVSVAAGDSVLHAQVMFTFR
jgi:biotin carboxyl carrier protein